MRKEMFSRFALERDVPKCGVCGVNDIRSSAGLYVGLSEMGYCDPGVPVTVGSHALPLSSYKPGVEACIGVPGN